MFRSIDDCIWSRVNISCSLNILIIQIYATFSIFATLNQFNPYYTKRDMYAFILLF